LLDTVLSAALRGLKIPSGRGLAQRWLSGLRKPACALVATNIAAVASNIRLDFIYISVVGTFRFLVASADIRDLLLRAKYLFVAARGIKP
jgi:hypothetical protein